MDIKPASSGKINPAQYSRTQASEAPEAGKGASGEKTGAAGSDGIELSEAAQALAQRSSEDLPPAGTLSPERLSALSRKIAGGHYDRPEVQDEVSRRLLSELDR